MEVPAFKQGESVMVSHGDLFYNAKVMAVQYRKNAWQYFVHYRGWSNEYDEWVRRNRMLKQTEDIKSEIKDITFRKPNLEIVPVEQESSASDSEEAPLRHRVRSFKPVLKPLQIVMPKSLRRYLKDNRQCVKLVRLPRKPSVEDVLRQFQDYKVFEEENLEKIDVEVSNGLRYFFDRALENLLLYEEEREQYASIVSSGRGCIPSTIYGVEHFLRLFCKLPELIVYDSLRDKELFDLEEAIMDVLRFIEQNESQFLC